MKVDLRFLKLSVLCSLIFYCGLLANNSKDLYKAADYKGIPYRLMKPQEMNKETSYPLILTLHGAGGKGSDNLKNLKTFNHRLTNKDLRTKYPCFVLAPQSLGFWRLPNDDSKLDPSIEETLTPMMSKFYKRMLKRNAPYIGNLDRVMDLLDFVIDHYPIDKKRIYLMGHSMGAMGTWNCLAARPDFFAASIASAGACFQNDLRYYNTTPIWMFHGAKDGVVSVDFSRTLFEKLSQHNPWVRYTEMDNVKHGADESAVRYDGDDEERGIVTRYSNDHAQYPSPDIWSWLFSQSK